MILAETGPTARAHAGEPYFYDDETGETQWDRPEE